MGLTVFGLWAIQIDFHQSEKEVNRVSYWPVPLSITMESLITPSNIPQKNVGFFANYFCLHILKTNKMYVSIVLFS